MAIRLLRFFPKFSFFLLNLVAVVVLMAVSVGCISAPRKSDQTLSQPSLVFPGSVTFRQVDSPLNHDSVNEIAVDSDNRIWIATALGVNVINRDIWTSFTSPGTKIGCEFCRVVEFDQKGNVWVAGVGNPSFYDGEAWSAFRSPSGGFNVSGIAFDSLGRAWFGETNRLLVKDGNTRPWIHVDLPKSDHKEYNHVSCLRTDPMGNMWAGIFQYGLTRIDTDTLEITRILSLDMGIDCALEFDRMGNAWFGTRDGLYFLNATELESLSLDSTPFVDYNVVDIALDTHDLPWITTRFGGIYAYDGTRWHTLIPQILSNQDTYAPSATNFPIAIDHEGNVWTGYSTIAVFLPRMGTGLLFIPHTTLPFPP